MEVEVGEENMWEYKDGNRNGERGTKRCGEDELGVVHRKQSGMGSKSGEGARMRR